jgi:hypothetical protein
MTPIVTLRQALEDPDLLGNVIPEDSWRLWRTLLIAAMGEPLDAGETELFRSVCGDRNPPAQRVSQFVAAAGRRAGKDRAVSCLATYLSALCDWSDVLTGGTRGVLLILAADKEQAPVQKDYIRAAFDASPALASMVVDETAEEIRLANGCVVSVRSASFRRIRGLTCIGIVASEVAFWYDESASGNTDEEILTAAMPALLTTRGPLVMISSVFRKKGELYRAYETYYGHNEPDVLVAYGPSIAFNNTLDQRIINRALERNEAGAKAEYLSIWRDDITDFISRSIVESCVDHGVLERPPRHGIAYRSFIDSSGGAHDSMVLAIGHKNFRPTAR